jgi:hypothetical protein
VVIFFGCKRHDAVTDEIYPSKLLHHLFSIAAALGGSARCLMFDQGERRDLDRWRRFMRSWRGSFAAPFDRSGRADYLEEVAEINGGGNGEEA